MKAREKTEKILDIATKRGFFYPSAEIYGSKSGFWTFGHLGTRIKHKWQDLWKDFFLGLSNNYFEIEDCNVLPKKVFMGSGHLEHFNDPLTECEKCHLRFRADELIEEALDINAEGLDEEAMTKLIEDNKLLCPKCQSKLLPVKMFNMMFDLKVGATGDEIMYLRPETAQAPFLAFKRQFNALRKKLPLGLAVIGRAYRNEISPRQGFFRLREFSQAELQIFFNPENIDKADCWDEVKDYKLRLFRVADRKSGKVKELTCNEANSKFKIPKFYVYHLAKVQQFYLNCLSLDKERFRLRELDEKERAFYNKVHFDVELNLDTLQGFKEVGGVHYRTDHDLGGHQLASKEKLEVFVDDKRFVPHVLELSFGVDRNVWALLDIFYDEDKERSFFRFPQIVSPIDVAVFPLVKKDNLPEKAKELFNGLRKHFKTFYDESGSVGKRYRRQDEIGTVYCVTVDHDTLDKGTVTIRDRDSMAQVKVDAEELVNVLNKLICSEITFEEAGKTT